MFSATPHHPPYVCAGWAGVHRSWAVGGLSRAASSHNSRDTSPSISRQQSMRRSVPNLHLQSPSEALSRTASQDLQPKTASQHILGGDNTISHSPGGGERADDEGEAPSAGTRSLVASPSMPASPFSGGRAGWRGGGSAPVSVSVSLLVLVTKEHLNNLNSDLVNTVCRGRGVSACGSL